MKVMIRMFKGEPIALFPYEVTGRNTVLSYAHTEQHSDAVWNLHQFTKPCPEPLAQEFQRTPGYRVRFPERYQA
jgi:hypothetical protein